MMINITLTQTNSSYGIAANDFSLLSNPIDLTIPAAEPTGKIATLNQTGYMIVEEDEILQAFIQTAANKVLEIGAAYGAASVQALEKRATVIANDIDERHLFLLRERVPQDQWNRLYLNKSRFPDQMNFPNNSLNAILMRHVIHFLNPDEIEIGFEKINQWLVKDGRLFIVVMSPYHHYFKNFPEQYEKRWQEGDRWPGIINNLKSYIPDQASKVPDFLHVMDHRPLQLALEKKGFMVEKIIAFDYHSHPKPEPIGLPGFCGMIARKCS